MRKIIFTLSIILGLNFNAHSQEGIPVYFDYLSDNYYLVFPSMAGIGSQGKIRITARQQWFDVDNAPNLQTANINMRVGERSGVGGILFNDANGYHSQSGIKGTFAHHLPLSSDFRILNQLSFGISGTLLLSSLDETEFRSLNPDPAVVGTKITASYFNIDLGASYTFGEFYMHAGILNLLQSKRELYRQGRTDDFDNLDVPRVDNLRRYLFSLGYIFGRGEFRVEPSIMFQMTDFTQEKTMDFNAKFYKDVSFGTLWGGLSYRRGFEGAQFQTNDSFGEQNLQLVTPILGANIKRFLVNYNYSYQMGDIRYGDGGFHQITLGYTFGEAPANRYECFCPASNY